MPRAIALTTLNETVEARGAAFPIHGVYEASYRAVVDAFMENYRVEDETGSSCSVIKNGKVVVDIWAGFADRERTRAWEKHSTVCMMSVAKGITSIGFNMLVDRGLIDVDAPVARYWPEFAQNGKAGIKVRWVRVRGALSTRCSRWPEIGLRSRRARLADPHRQIHVATDQGGYQEPPVESNPVTVVTPTSGRLSATLVHAQQQECRS